MDVVTAIAAKPFQLPVDMRRRWADLWRGSVWRDSAVKGRWTAVGFKVLEDEIGKRVYSRARIVLRASTWIRQIYREAQECAGVENTYEGDIRRKSRTINSRLYLRLCTRTLPQSFISNKSSGGNVEFKKYNEAKETNSIKEVRGDEEMHRDSKEICLRNVLCPNGVF
ncbi:hypothetical protein PV326_010996 [Microctonus aethiopoides]|nr:hypothetical protein PV326_010996 [Microctonus aethiopoides]